MMTKEDYMHLSKERLAELNVEKDELIESLKVWKEAPVQPYPYSPLGPYVHWQGAGEPIPCYANGGVCTNPHFDCINCPRHSLTGGWSTSTSTTGKLNETEKAE